MVARKTRLGLLRGTGGGSGSLLWPGNRLSKMRRDRTAITYTMCMLMEARSLTQAFIASQLQNKVQFAGEMVVANV
jgi:hypothetical protein